MKTMEELVKDFEKLSPHKQKLVMQLFNLANVARSQAIQEAIKVVEEKKNPYPPDVYVSKVGKFGHKVYENCKEDIVKVLKNLGGQNEQERSH